MTLTHLSLFSGIGGIDLAAEWAGFETVCFVENNDYCQKVLKKHWPDVPIWSDIHDFEWRDSVTLITAGVPCQPASVAGKQRGKEDDRWLWPETFRVIQEVKPTWVCCENPTGIITMVEFSGLFLEMERIGYETQAFIIPASAIGAPHRRNRVFILAYSQSVNEQRGFLKESIGECPQKQFRRLFGATRWRDWPNDLPRPYTCGKHDGIPNRVDRLRALGNAVVPQQIYPILKAIADIEKQGLRCDGLNPCLNSPPHLFCEA